MGHSRLSLEYNQINPAAQQAVDAALAELPRAVERRTERRTVTALQRLALAWAAYGASSARWSIGGAASSEPSSPGLLAPSRT